MCFSDYYCCTHSYTLNRLGEAEFLRRYSLEMSDSFGVVLHRLEEEGKKDGTIKS